MSRERLPRSASFPSGNEITKVTEQLLQAIANSDYEMYK